MSNLAAVAEQDVQAEIPERLDPDNHQYVDYRINRNILIAERSPFFGNYNTFTVVGPEFFASNECRDRGDRPRRVAEPRGRPPVRARVGNFT